MKERLRSYLDKLFMEAGQNQQAEELREEMYANLCDKYDNLVARGMTEEEAYYSAIASIGNIDELLGELGPGRRVSTPDEQQKRERNALLNAMAGACPFFAVGGFFVGSMLFDSAAWGFLLLFLFIGAGVALRSFARLSASPAPRQGTGRRRTYIKGQEGETVVEEFKEFRRGKSRNEQLKSTINTCLWLVIVMLYFVISFTTHAWHATWLIFLVGVALSQAIKCYFSLKDIDEDYKDKE